MRCQLAICLSLSHFIGCSGIEVSALQWNPHHECFSTKSPNPGAAKSCGDGAVDKLYAMLKSQEVDFANVVGLDKDSFKPGAKYPWQISRHSPCNPHRSTALIYNQENWKEDTVHETTACVNNIANAIQLFTRKPALATSEKILVVGAGYPSDTTPTTDDDLVVEIQKVMNNAGTGVRVLFLADTHTKSSRSTTYEILRKLFPKHGNLVVAETDPYHPSCCYGDFTDEKKRDFDRIGLMGLTKDDKVVEQDLQLIDNVPSWAKINRADGTEVRWHKPVWARFHIAPTSDYEDEWNKYCAHQQQYNSDCDGQPTQVFIDNVKTVKKANEQNSHDPNHDLKLSFKGPFAAMTQHKYSQILQARPEPVHGDIPMGTHVDDGHPSPPSIDWTTEDAVTDVKTQDLNCATCWAYAATGVLESRWHLAGNKLLTLSEQQLMDCCPDCHTNQYNKCKGGSVEDAFGFHKKNAIATESSYHGSCENHYTPGIPKGSVDIVRSVPAYQDSLKHAVAHGPVSVLVYADLQAFQLYGRGIFSGSGTYACNNENNAPNHAMIAVGYGKSNGYGKGQDRDYWKLKNSWGTSWGMRGYMLMDGEKNGNKKGKCGILSDASYPHVDTPAPPVPPGPDRPDDHPTLYCAADGGNDINNRCHTVESSSGQCMTEYTGRHGAGCQGLYCNANGMDGNCYWCMYDKALCEKVYGDACNHRRPMCHAPQLGSSVAI